MLFSWTRRSAKTWFNSKRIKNGEVVYLMGVSQEESFSGKAVNWEPLYQPAYCRIAQRSVSNSVFSYIMAQRVTQDDLQCG